MSIFEINVYVRPNVNQGYCFFVAPAGAPVASFDSFDNDIFGIKEFNEELNFAGKCAQQAWPQSMSPL